MEMNGKTDSAVSATDEEQEQGADEDLDVTPPPFNPQAAEK